MKILVDREFLLEINKLLYKYDMLHDSIEANKLRIPLEEILKANPESSLDYPGLDPVTQKAYDKIRAGVNIGKKDPRCDGCVYQHPFAENIDIDELNGVVMCKRNVNQHYIEDGRWVTGFGKGQGLMVCEVYRLRDIDNELVRI